MMLKIALIPMVVALSAASVLAVAAQNQQNREVNDANQIQRDYSSGLINQNQAVKLETRDAQIEAQTQQDMNQNGGKLTNQERGQINSELNGLNRHTGNDLQRDNPNSNFNPQQAGQWQNRNGFNGNFGNPSNMQNSQNTGAYPNQRRHHNRFNQQQQTSPYNAQQQQYWQH
jgi:hypothetical protein